MSEIARALWERAEEALAIARMAVELGPNSSASRSYYAAFQALSAYFALRGKTFTKHAQLRAAFHTDLVRPGVWPKSFAEDFGRLWESRQTGDYGDIQKIDSATALRAVDAATRILDKVRASHPDIFGDA